MIGKTELRKFGRKYGWVVLFLLLALASFFARFSPGIQVYSNFQKSFIEMVTFLPLLFILIGLFDVWVPREKIEKYIGKDSGIIGILMVIFLAMLQAGPLYGAFPVAYILYKKGARVRNIFIFLGAFSSLKIAMLGLEIGYLGLKYTLVRSLVSLPLFILVGFLMEKILGKDFEVKEAKEAKGSD